MATVNMFGGQQKGLSVKANNQTQENCYLVPSPFGVNQMYLTGAPGTRVFSASAGIARGGIVANSEAYFVMDQSLVKVDSFGTKTTLGTIPGVDRVSLTRDDKYIVIVNGTFSGYFYDYLIGSFTEITLPYRAYTVTQLDTYIIMSSDDQRWFISEVGSPTTFNSLDFASAVKSPDALLAVFEDHGEIILFGEEVTEAWYNSGDPDFTFSKNVTGLVERGLYARHAITKEDNTFFFLGDDLIVYRMEGYNPIRVSDESIEAELSRILRNGGGTDLKNAFCYSYTDHGHKFFTLTVPNRVTYEFNIATGLWHRRKHFDYETHHVAAVCNAYDKTILGTITGDAMYYDRDYYKDGSRPLKRLVRSQYYAADGKRIRWKKIKFEFDFGTTEVLSGQGSDPVVALRWSEDSGRTFGNEKYLKMGENGRYLEKAIARNLGSSRHRLYEYYVTDDAPFFVTAAYATVS